MELFPWNTSWYIRKIGLCDPDHNMRAAFIRGQQAHTPSWESSRRGVFMKTDNSQPDPWMLEDVELQCRLSAEKMDEALRIGRDVIEKIPEPLAETFRETLADWTRFRRCALSYASHLRETNLANVMRRRLATGQPLSARLTDEMISVLTADSLNRNDPSACDAAIAQFHDDPAAFLKRYFLPPEEGEPDPGQKNDPAWSHKGGFSVTSR